MLRALLLRELIVEWDGEDGTRDWVRNQRLTALVYDAMLGLT